MAADLNEKTGRPESEPRLRFALLVQADRGAILALFAKRLDDQQGIASTDSSARKQAMATAAEMLADIIARLQGDDAGKDGQHPTLTWLAGATSQFSLTDLLRASITFSDVALNALARHVRDDPELLSCFVAAVLALHGSISRRVGDAMAAYTGYLLEQVDQARADERLRIARDLHDRLGEQLSIALRQLELHEIERARDQASSEPRAARAKDAITEALSRLRVITSGLREDPVRNLETALVKYLDSVEADAEVRLRISGYEAWASPEVIDEAYQIIREALRNAFTHSGAELVRIGITIAPQEFSAWVEDDGHGFDAGDRTGPASAGTGLAAMRERAASLGGRLTLASVPGQGTYVGLVVSLAGHHDE